MIVTEHFCDLTFRYHNLNDTQNKKLQDQCPEDLPQHGKSHIQGMAELMEVIHRIFPVSQTSAVRNAAK
jgi:hypothetical protein